MVSEPSTEPIATAAPKTAAPVRRVVLLGASNLTRAFPVVMETACAVLGRPLEVLAALGHGRSYGIPSTVMGRTMRGIHVCGLWDALRTRPPVPTAALVTDVGNDILYGVPVPTIAGWIDDCLERLQASGTKISMTLLPLRNLDLLPEWRFRFFRRCCSRSAV